MAAPAEPDQKPQEKPMTLEEALAYMTPHPNNNSTISLQAHKARKAMAVIVDALADDPSDPDLDDWDGH